MKKWSWVLQSQHDWKAKNKDELIEEIQRFLLELAEAPKWEMEKNIQILEIV